MVSFDESKILEAFMEEVKELLETLNQKLLELENSPQDEEVINEIFRLTHSVKSESALVGLKNISTIAHKMEDIFEKVRKKELNVDTKIMNNLFSAYDRIMLIIGGVQDGKSDSSYSIEDVLNPLLSILNQKPIEAKAATISNEEKKDKDNSNNETFGTVLKFDYRVLENLGDMKFTDIEKNQIEESSNKGEKFYKLDFHIEDECDMKYPRAYLVFNNFDNIGTVIKTIPDIQTETNDDKFSNVTIFVFTSVDINKIKECADVDQVDKLLVSEIKENLVKAIIDNVVEINNVINQNEIETAEDIERKWAEELEKTHKNSEKLEDNKDLTDSINKKLEESKTKLQNNAEKLNQKQTIRVDIERLDELLNLVGELIINRSRFVQITDNINESISIQDLKTELEDATNELERISDQMQMKMMQARMVPIGNIFSKFPRMVRDLANSLHKNISLEIIGESTEIDRTVIENLSEPLTHIIRNSIDHGIEMPDERGKSGKSREGKVVLKAYQEGSNIYIEITDDGKGIDIEAVRSKAIEKGLVTSSQAQNLPNQEILNFIFEPGFSTKKEITDLSGRGVGMDVVKTQIEKLRGRVDISTKINQGTKFTIILPLTTTIVEALLVNVGKNIFAIPISVVEETIKVNKKEIKDFDDYQVYNLRNETLAIIQLSNLVGLDKKNESDYLYIVVITFERRRIGVVVDDLMGEQDIVIKALDDVLKNSEGVAGAAVLGDGRIALILDTSTLVKAALKEINKLAQDLSKQFDSEDLEYKDISSLYDTFNKSNQPQKTSSSIKITDNTNNNPKPEMKNTIKKNDDEALKKIEEIMNDLKN